MITIDLWVNDDFKLHGIIFEDVWLYSNLNTVVEVLQHKLYRQPSYGFSPTETIQRHRNGECSTQIYYYTTVSFDSLDELLPTLSKQHPELLL